MYVDVVVSIENFELHASTLRVDDVDPRHKLLLPVFKLRSF